MAKKADLTDSDWQIAIGYASGMTQEAIAEHLGVSSETIRLRKQDPERHQLDRRTALAEAILARQWAKKLAREGESAEERLKGFFDRSFRVSEALLRKIEAQGDGAEVADLMEVHKNFTMWAAKFAASEKPKHVKTEIAGEVTHTHVIDFDEALRIHQTEKEIAQLRVTPALPPANVEEAVLV